MKADEDTTKEVLAVLDRLSAAYEARDLEGACLLFSPNAETSFFGAGGHAPYVGPEGIRTIVGKIVGLDEVFTLRLREATVSARGDVAWCVADAEIVARLGTAERRHPYRMTVILEGGRGRWRIAHHHGSEPAE
jgi:ketosteroid isomerase-like protein